MANAGTFQKGHKHSPEVRAKIAAKHKGKPAKWISSLKRDEIRQKISETKRGIPNLVMRGQGNHRWKGGITSENQKIRHCLEYKIWRRAVFERDNYHCIWGGKEHGNNIQADHIKPFAEYPELRFAIDNGRTLCIECHKTVGTWGRRKKV